MTQSTLQSETDEELMLAIANREEDAFSQLYDRYSSAAYAVCLRILRRPIDAQAVLSDVFWEIWQNAEQFNPKRGSVRTYLMMLARSRAIDRLRADTGRSTREKKYSEQRSERMRESQASENPVQLVIAGEDSSQIAVAISELSESQHQVLQMAFYRGMTHREIAEETEMPLGTVKTHIRQGLFRLGQILRTMNTSWTGQ